MVHYRSDLPNEMRTSADNPVINHIAEAVSLHLTPFLLQMTHLATPSSREANPGPAVEGAGNISQPSSLQSTPRAGIPMPLSNSSELDRVSGTLDNISRDEDAEPIMTVGEYCGALSKTGSVSSRTRKSLSSSDRSILFAPSYGVLTMTLHELVEYLQSK